MIRISR